MMYPVPIVSETDILTPGLTVRRPFWLSGHWFSDCSKLSQPWTSLVCELVKIFCRNIWPQYQVGCISFHLLRRIRRRSFVVFRLFFCVLSCRRWKLQSIVPRILIQAELNQITNSNGINHAWPICSFKILAKTQNSGSGSVKHTTVLVQRTWTAFTGWPQAPSLFPPLLNPSL